MNEQELLEIVYIDTDSLSCNIATQCAYKERTISYAIGVEIPNPSTDPDIIFKECCYTHVVLADLNSSQDFKNDYSAFYHQRQMSTETADFFLYRYSNGQEYPLNNDTYGQFFGFGYFPTNVNLKGYKVEWRKVLQTLGAGSYKIIKRQNIAGISIDINSFTFTLKQFSTSLADKTVRIDIVMNGRLEKEKIEFKDTAWKHSMRVAGFFGRREPQFEEDNLVGRDYHKNQISMTQKNEYKFQTNYIPSCITAEIFDFMLFANDIFMNDYNLNNHSYNFVKFGVKFSSNDGTTYGVQTRNARLNLVFEDKYSNRIKRNFN